jgi:integrase-like protein
MDAAHLKGKGRPLLAKDTGLRQILRCHSIEPNTPAFFAPEPKRQDRRANRGARIGIHRKKTGKEYVIPLSAQAIALLDRIKKWQDANGIKSDYIFPGGQGGRSSGHLEHSTVNKFLKHSLGYPDITVHGFRHTFFNEYDDTNSEIALGHIVGSKSRRAYKDAIQRLRAIHRMVQAYAVYCDQIPPLPSEKKAEDNVASLERERAARRNAG